MGIIGSSGKLVYEVKTRVDDDLKERLRRICDKQDRTESAITRRALREFIEREETS